MNFQSLYFFIFAVLTSFVFGTRYSSEKILSMVQELRHVDLREDLYSIQDNDLRLIIQSVLNHESGIDIPAALKFYLIRYFERRGEVAPQTLFEGIPRDKYVAHLSVKAVIQETEPGSEISNAETILILLDDGFKIVTRPYLVMKIANLISGGYYSHAASLFEKIDKINVPSAILGSAVDSNNLDLVEFILENTESFDFLQYECFADQYVHLSILRDNIDMLDLLMVYRDKLVFTPQINRRVQESVRNYRCSAQMAARVSEYFSNQEQEAPCMIEQITLEEQSP